jgi:hypothetical protein
MATAAGPQKQSTIERPTLYKEYEVYVLCMIHGHHSFDLTDPAGPIKLMVGSEMTAELSWFFLHLSPDGLLATSGNVF